MLKRKKTKVAQTSFTTNSSTVPPHCGDHKDISHATTNSSRSFLRAPLGLHQSACHWQRSQIKTTPLVQFVAKKAPPAICWNFRSSAFRTLFMARQLTPTLLECIFLQKIKKNDIIQQERFCLASFPTVEATLCLDYQDAKEYYQQEKITRKKMQACDL